MESGSLNEVRDKFKRVLNGLLKRDYNVSNDVYFEMFITHLSGKNGEDYSKLLQESFVFDYIEQSVQQIASINQENLRIFSLTFQLIALLAENVETFQKLNERNVFDNYETNLKILSTLQSPTIKLAKISLFQAMCKHSHGLEWIKKMSCWKVVIEFCMNNQTIYVVRKAIDSITEYLFNVVARNEEDLCLEIIQEVMRPLDENVFVDHLGKVCVDSSDLKEKVTPTINIISNILHRYIQTDTKSNIATHIIKTCKGQRNLWKLTDMTQDQVLFEKIISCHVYINFALLMDTRNNERVTDKSMISVVDYNEFGLNFLNQIKFCILKNQLLALLAVARLYYVLWKELGDRVPEEIIMGNQLTKFENQIILFQIMPLVYMMNRHPSQYTEITDEFIMKLFNISSEHTLRICYSFRDSMSRSNTDISNMAIKAVQVILSMEKVLHRDRAVIVFQALCHILKGFAFERTPEDILLMVERPNLFTSILTGIHTIVKNFRITWKESYESIHVLNCMLALLEHTNLPTKLAVHVLKLTQLAVEYFLAPNLALLVDSLAGSDMQKLGPMILKRLHDNNWEIRDSVLELLASISSISVLKFPAFQQHILENGLCPVVVQVAQNDAEPYVRASALKCLSQMVHVTLLWEHYLSSMNLISYLMNVLLTDSEGIVRKEAVTLITSIYENQKVSGDQLDCIFSTLAYSAVNDLYWEVKVQSLEFWQVVIKRQLQHQGVIDGTFPSVTFSKEKKKIVTLTPKEIILRLTKVLNELSLRGCLGVLLACITDDADLIVMKATINVIRSLITFLDKYNYYQEIEEIQHENYPRPHSTLDTNYSEYEKPNLNANTERNSADLTNSEEIIQSIVSMQDINLLSVAYENHLNVVPNTENPIDSDYFKKFSNVTATIFLHKIKTTDFDALIQSRSDWLCQTESFSSLLNDILYSMKLQDDVNDADCY